MSLFFSHKRAVSIYVFSWIAFALFQAFVLKPLIELSFPQLIADAAIYSIILAILTLLLWNAIRYMNLSMIPSFQKITNFFALGLVFVGFSLLLTFIFEEILFKPDILIVFKDLLLFRIYIGTTVFLIAVLYFLSYLCNAENLTDKKDEEEDFEQEELETSKKEYIKHIAVKKGNTIAVIMLHEIQYIQADGDYVQIVTADKKYMKEQTMKYFQEHLPENIFVRVHRSYFVNIKAISSIELFEKQTQQLRLKNGDNIKLSQAGYKTLRKALQL